MNAAELVKMSILHPDIAREQRDIRIRAMRLDGMTLQAIADSYGLTRARVQQICKVTEPNLYTSAATCAENEEK